MWTVKCTQQTFRQNRQTSFKQDKQKVLSVVVPFLMASNRSLRPSSSSSSSGVSSCLRASMERNDPDAAWSMRGSSIPPAVPLGSCCCCVGALREQTEARGEHTKHHSLCLHISTRYVTVPWFSRIGLASHVIPVPKFLCRSTFVYWVHVQSDNTQRLYGNLFMNVTLRKV